MTKLRDMVDVNTIVGAPITTPDGITIIPVSRVSFGFASGASDFPAKDKTAFGGGNGAGVRIDPLGFLIIRDGNVRMLNMAPPPGNTLDRVVEMIPGVLDRVEEFMDKQKKTEPEA